MWNAKVSDKAWPYKLQQKFIFRIKQLDLKQKANACDGETLKKLLWLLYVITY